MTASAPIPVPSAERPRRPGFGDRILELRRRGLAGGAPPSVGESGALVTSDDGNGVDPRRHSGARDA